MMRFDKMTDQQVEEMKAEIFKMTNDDEFLLRSENAYLYLERCGMSEWVITMTFCDGTSATLFIPTKKLDIFIDQYDVLRVGHFDGGFRIPNINLMYELTKG